MTSPNFLIVGAARSGTTSLYYYLQQHPEIGFAKERDSMYFSLKQLNIPHNGPGDDKIDKYIASDFEEYVGLFASLGAYKRIGEAGRDYLYYYEKAPQEIYTTLGDIPIIMVLRNPTIRAFSAYSYLVRDNRERLPFREALAAEAERLSNNWYFMWAYKRTGLYYKQVHAYMERFTNVEIILNEALKNNPHTELKKIYSTLGVDDTFAADTSIQHNPSGKPTNALAKFMFSRNNRLSASVRQFLKEHVPMEILSKVAGRYLARLKLSEEDRMYLTDYFREDVGKLEKLIGKDLTHWKDGSM